MTRLGTVSSSPILTQSVSAIDCHYLHRCKLNYLGLVLVLVLVALELLLAAGLRTAGRIGVHRAPLHLDRRRADAPGHQALALRVQSRRRVQLAAVLPARVCPPGPENLRCRRGAGPHEGVEVLRVDGLGPDGDLAAEDELRRSAVEALGGVVRVNELPALRRAAPVVKREARLPDVVVPGNPLTAAAVEVLFKS